jgi:hypothetical protein
MKSNRIAHWVRILCAIVLASALGAGCGRKSVRTRPDKIIESVEKTYSGLRRDHPDRDEHWLLANTWLERYGATREAKHKGPEVTRFIAYKETHQFSILEPPESIRALALFLVYKELGAAAEPYGAEFARIMEPVLQVRADCCFFERYKQRNPRTVSECQAQPPGPFSLSSFLEGLERFDRDPEFRQEVEGLSRELEMEQGGLL